MSFTPRGPFGRRGKSSFSDTVHLAPGPPPPYTEGYAPPPGPQWHPRNWSRKVLLAVGGAVVVLLVVIVAVAVTVSKNNRYPDYSRLDYVLKDTYSGPSFFDDFDYFTGYDPTGGFVHYVDRPGSVALNLTSASASSAVLRVDTSEISAPTGRRSARVTSKRQYDSGLFVFDVKHTPHGCGTWPALWLTDPANWPRNGEIDVVEAVNAATTGNQVTLHTTDGCRMAVRRKQRGKQMGTNCFNGTNGNEGCAVQGAPDTFGPAFNANGGGVYATELRAAGIRVWFFPRASIPADVMGSTPDPSRWGDPLADFPSTDCPVGQHFRNQSIVANVALCGTWAGAPDVYNAQGACPGTCGDLVANNASAFANAYWEFGEFKVYQTG
ncbi:MAG: hypothetical protein M1832_002871 [Thelocarpon impressellum]|nr:MAG: hypothetical protein M1832_002871 [Thelocarpon impressellum]